MLREKIIVVLSSFFCHVANALIIHHRVVAICLSQSGLRCHNLKRNSSFGSRFEMPINRKMVEECVGGALRAHRVRRAREEELGAITLHNPLKKNHGHEHAKGSDPVVSRVTRGGKR